MKGVKTLVAVITASAMLNACSPKTQNMDSDGLISHTMGYDSINYNLFGISVDNSSPEANIRSVYKNMSDGNFSIYVTDFRNGFNMEFTPKLDNLGNLVDYMGQIEEQGENPYEVIGEDNLERISMGLKDFLEKYSNFASSGSELSGKNPELDFYFPALRNIDSDIESVLKEGISDGSYKPTIQMKPSPLEINNALRRMNGELVPMTRPSRDIYDIIED